MSYDPRSYPGIRPYVCNGQHESLAVVSLWATQVGSVETYICRDPCCAEIVKCQCNHDFCSWNAERTILNCDLCGVDET